MPPGLTLPNSTSATALPASMPGNQASRIAGDAASTFESVSGRPLKSTTTNGLPGGLDRVDELLLPAGQVDVAARRRLAAHARASRRGPARPGRPPAPRPRPRRSRRPSRTRRGRRCPAGPCRPIVQPCANVVFGSWALMPSNTDTASVVLALAPPRAEHVVLVVAQRADHGGRLGRRRAAASPPSFLSSTIDLPAAVRAAARSAGVTKLRRVVGLRLVDVRVLEQPGAELDAQDAAHGVVDARHRDPAAGRAAACRSRGCSC